MIYVDGWINKYFEGYQQDAGACINNDQWTVILTHFVISHVKLKITDYSKHPLDKRAENQANKLD